MSRAFWGTRWKGSDILSERDTDSAAAAAAANAPVPVQPLGYQLRSDSRADPWATVVRMVAWAAAAYAGATLFGAVFSVLFRWSMSQRGATVWDPQFVLLTLGKMFYVPVLVAAMACARLRRGGWAWLKNGLLILLVIQIAVLLGGGVLIMTTSPFRRFGTLPSVGLVGQNFFAIAANTVPLGLMYGLLTRPGARAVFATP